MRVICYYSYTGNTRRLAYKIKEKYGYDLLEIKPLINYSNDYDKVVNEAKEDVEINYQPEIYNIDISKYDEIILLTPVWWYTFASPVNSFLHKYNFSNKIIIPVITNGGWPGHTFEDIEKVSKSIIKNKLSLKFNNDKLLEEEKFINWLDRLGENDD